MPWLIRLIVSSKLSARRAPLIPLSESQTGELRGVLEPILSDARPSHDTLQLTQA